MQPQLEETPNIIEIIDQQPEVDQELNLLKATLLEDLFTQDIKLLDEKLAQIKQVCWYSNIETISTHEEYFSANIIIGNFKVEVLANKETGTKCLKFTDLSEPEKYFWLSYTIGFEGTSDYLIEIEDKESTPKPLNNDERLTTFCTNFLGLGRSIQELLDQAEGQKADDK